MMWRTFVAMATLLALSGPALAQQAVFVVRHAERADTAPGMAPPAGTSGSDPSLSDVGHARAASLAALLKDAGITAIFVTEFKRTQETAAPLAKALGLTPTVVPAADTKALIARLNGTTSSALVVGHSNTVPDVVKGLGVAAPVTVADTAFDNLFIVLRQPPARVIHLHFR